MEEGGRPGRAGSEDGRPGELGSGRARSGRAGSESRGIGREGSEDRRGRRQRNREWRERREQCGWGGSIDGREEGGEGGRREVRQLGLQELLETQLLCDGCSQVGKMSMLHVLFLCVFLVGLQSLTLTPHWSQDPKTPVLGLSRHHRLYERSPPMYSVCT